MVGEATSEGSEETSSFLVRLFKKHTIIVSLDLNWSGIVLLLEVLLLKHWLLLDDLSVLSSLSAGGAGIS